MAVAKPQTAARALNGELVVLPWKGGLEVRDPAKPEKAVKGKKATKYGCLLYLAMWQGVRGEDLLVETGLETTLVCSRTMSAVTYTPDSTKYVISLD